MSEAKTIARPYAVAAWRHAEGQGKQDLWSDMLDFMALVIRDETVSAVVSDPRVEPATLSRLMLDICSDKINQTGEAFVRLLVENGKLALVPEIAAVYQELKAEAGGAVQATLVAAYPVNPEFEQSIASAMKARLDREVSFSTEIDEGLLGGVIIRAGDMVIDASIRGQIEALAADLRM